MKKLVSLLIIIVLGTLGLSAQDRIQDKLQLRDGSCLDTQNSVVILGDQDRLLLRLRDGSCIDLTALGISSGDQDKIKLQLRDGSCLDIVDSTSLTADKDRDSIKLQLRDGSCLDSTSILQQFLNLFKF